VRKQISELKTAQKDASAEDKEKRKQEKMAMMMAKFDTVSRRCAVRTRFFLLRCRITH
jgi:hypothetical protein